MSPPLPPSRPKARSRAGRGVLIAVGLFVLSQLLLSVSCETNPGLRDPAYGDKLTKLKARRDESKPLVLMLGSSRTLLGFHAGRLEEQSGETVQAFNFGTPSSGPITHLVYLKRLLAEGIVPDQLLVEVLPPLLADGPGGAIEGQFLTGERLTAGELKTVERHGFEPSRVRASWREAAVLPAWKLRFQLLGRVAPSWLPWNQRFDWSRTADAHGWSTPPKQAVTAEERGELEAKVRDEYAATLAGLDPHGRPLAALREVTALCHSRGIPVRLVLMPEGSSFRRLYPDGLDDRIEAALNSLGVPVVDARGWLTDDQMYDGHHPFASGAVAFTDRLVPLVPTAGESCP